MLRKRLGIIEWLEFEIFQEVPNFVHGVFLRHGGVSVGEFSSLNVGRSQGDDLIAVDTNLKKIREILDVPLLSFAKQHHSPFVCEVTQGDKERPLCDALVTQEQGLGLLLNHADCQVAIIVDPVRRVLANVHAGWRGNVQNIYKNTIDTLKQKFHSKPEDLLVGISPSLGPEASEFINYRTEFPETFWTFQYRPHYFNLWEISRWQLECCGVLTSHIEIASICTYTNSADFFSYRREKKSGRHATAAAFL
ncbi:MAG: polyphenol oxidase family protein [Chlamydiota bacterium]